MGQDTDARRRRAAEMRAAGSKLGEIAEALGVTPQRASQMVRQGAAPRRCLGCGGDLAGGDARRYCRTPCLPPSERPSARPRGRPPLDLTGKPYGLWTVLRPGQRPRHYLCRCACGVESEVSADSLVGGHSGGCRACRSGRRAKPKGQAEAPARKGGRAR